MQPWRKHDFSLQLHARLNLKSALEMTLQCTCLHTYYVHVHIVLSVAACDQSYSMVGVLAPLPYWYTFLIGIPSLLVYLPYWYTLKLLTLISRTHLFTSRTHLVYMLKDALATCWLYKDECF